jgi:PadR family transcriptional regulator PadR
LSVSELRPDDAELVVLAVLLDDALYGYAITKRVSARSGGEIVLSPGVLYPLLAKLESQGFIASEWETIRSDRNQADEGGRRRKWYRLSAKGRKRLAQRVEAHRHYQSMIQSFIASEGGAA